MKCKPNGCNRPKAFRAPSNASLLRAIEQAALASRRNVTQADVQQAFDALSWLAAAAPRGVSTQRPDGPDWSTTI